MPESKFEREEEEAAAAEAGGIGGRVDYDPEDGESEVDPARAPLIEAGEGESEGFELAEYLELSSEEVLDGLQTAEAYDTLSLDAPRPVDNDSPVSRLEAIGDEDTRLEMVDDQATIFAAAQHLPERERQILFLRFGADLTQTEIAEQVGVSQMQVSRLLRKSLQRLRDLTGER